MKLIREIMLAEIALMTLTAYFLNLMLEKL
jgi:hypothetical protein